MQNEEKDCDEDSDYFTQAIYSFVFSLMYAKLLWSSR